MNQIDQNKPQFNYWRVCPHNIQIQKEVEPVIKQSTQPVEIELFSFSVHRSKLQRGLHNGALFRVTFAFLSIQ